MKKINLRLIAIDRLVMKFTTPYFIENKNASGEFFLNGIEIKRHTQKKFRLGYEQTFDILYWGKLLGYAHVRPDQRTYMAKEVVSIEFENYIFYDSQFGEAYKALLDCQELNLTYKCFTAIDIAVDTTENIVERYEWFESRKDTYTRNKKLKVRYDETIEGRLLGPYAFYNKSSELLNSGKEYIRAFHEANLPALAIVYRDEARLSNKMLSNAKIRLDHTRITETDYLISVFQHFSNRDLYWTKKQNGVTTKHYLLEFDMTNLPTIKKVEKTVSMGLTPRQASRLVDTLILAYALINNYTIEEIEQFIQDLISRYRIFKWEDKRWLSLYAKHLMFVQKQFDKVSILKLAA